MVSRGQTADSLNDECFCKMIAVIERQPLVEIKFVYSLMGTKNGVMMVAVRYTQRINFPSVTRRISEGKAAPCLIAGVFGEPGGPAQRASANARLIPSNKTGKTLLNHVQFYSFPTAKKYVPGFFCSNCVTGSDFNLIVSTVKQPVF